MNQRRFLVGRIEEPDNYTMSEVGIALSDSVHKAVEYVLQIFRTRKPITV